MEVLRSSLGASLVDRCAQRLKCEQEAWAQGRWLLGTDEVGRGCIAGPVVTSAACLPPIFFQTDSEGFSVLQGQGQKDQQIPFNGESSTWGLVRDSKKITPSSRERLAQFLEKNVEHSIDWLLPSEIDEINILEASLKAMRKSVWKLLARVFIRRVELLQRQASQIQIEEFFHFFHSKVTVLVDGHQNPFTSRHYGREFFSQECTLIDLRGVHPTPFDELLQKIPLLSYETQTLIQGDDRSLSIGAASILAKVYRDDWMTRLAKEHPLYGFDEHKGYPTPRHKEALRAHGWTSWHRRSFSVKGISVESLS